MVCYVKGKGRGLASELMEGDGLEEKTEKGYWSINCVLNIMFPGITVQAQRVRNMGSHIIRTVEEGIYRFIWTGRGKMNQCGYLVYGARCSDFYCGCDAYGYGYNDICSKYLDELDNISGDGGAYLSRASAMNCFEECVKQNVPANIIFCCVINDTKATLAAECAPPEEHMKFLGFDIAWNEYDYYSSILHEVISERGALHDQRAMLNAHGLFAEYSQAKKYLETRSRRKAAASEGKFEEGDLYIVAVWA